MSHDPFQELFDREMPRPASPASTRATLDELKPQFHRMRIQRRARVGAMAAIAILGTSGGAAALGLSPIGAPSPRTTDFASLANSTAVENLSDVEETPTTTITATSTTTTSMAPVVVTTTTPEETDPVEGPESEVDDDTTPEHDDESSVEVDGDETDDSSDETHDDDSDATDSKDDSDDTPSDSDSGSSDDPDDDDDGDDDNASAPVPGPLTKTIVDGSVTVGLGDHGLLFVNVTPAEGVDYELDADPDEIKVTFIDSATGNELHELDFKLVDGGITVEVDPPSSSS